MPVPDDSLIAAFGRAEEQLVKITVRRRTARYRGLLVRGTGLDGRTTSMRVLRAVSDAERTGDTASVLEVASRLFMEHSNASRAVDQVVVQGLLTKRRSADDGRRVELTPTSRGRRAIAELDGRRAAVHAELIAGWPQEDVETLGALLERLGRAYDEVLAGDDVAVTGPLDPSGR